MSTTHVLRSWPMPTEISAPEELEPPTRPAWRLRNIRVGQTPPGTIHRGEEERDR